MLWRIVAISTLVKHVMGPESIAGGYAVMVGIVGGGGSGGGRSALCSK